MGRIEEAILLDDGNTPEEDCAKGKR